jgi:hypothetical protein
MLLADLIATTFGWLSRLRGRRIFHPAGVAFRLSGGRPAATPAWRVWRRTDRPWCACHADWGCRRPYRTCWVSRSRSWTPTVPAGTRTCCWPARDTARSGAGCWLPNAGSPPGCLVAAPLPTVRASRARHGERPWRSRSDVARTPPRLRCNPDCGGVRRRGPDRGGPARPTTRRPARGRPPVRSLAHRRVAASRGVAQPSASSRLRRQPAGAGRAGRRCQGSARSARSGSWVMWAIMAIPADVQGERRDPRDEEDGGRAGAGTVVGTRGGDPRRKRHAVVVVRWCAVAAWRPAHGKR